MFYESQLNTIFPIAVPWPSITIFNCSPLCKSTEYSCADEFGAITIVSTVFPSTIKVMLFSSSYIRVDSAAKDIWSNYRLNITQYILKLTFKPKASVTFIWIIVRIKTTTILSAVFISVLRYPVYTSVGAVSAAESACWYFNFFRFFQLFFHFNYLQLLLYHS